MWKALSLAIGITSILIGLELFFVSELEVRRLRAPQQAAAQQSLPNPFQPASWGQPLVAPPVAETWTCRPRDWMPWSMLAVGSIVVIYTFTLPVRRREAA
jgi:hypothetical protein